jgi:hypothetical protein
MVSSNYGAVCMAFLLVTTQATITLHAYDNTLIGAVRYRERKRFMVKGGGSLKPTKYGTNQKYSLHYRCIPLLKDRIDCTTKNGTYPKLATL